MFEGRPLGDICAVVVVVVRQVLSKSQWSEDTFFNIFRREVGVFISICVCRQVFGYVREGNKIKPLVHRDTGTTGAVGHIELDDEVDACVMRCDGAPVAYHRWRGVHGILLPVGVARRTNGADLWDSIDIGENFSANVPPADGAYDDDNDGELTSR